MSIIPDRISLWRIFAVLVAILAVVLACQRADAQIGVIRSKGGRDYYLGSCVCIGRDSQERSVILTASHNVDGFSGHEVAYGKWYPAKLVATTGVKANEGGAWKPDLALLLCDYQVDGFHPLADTVPNPGDQLSIGGYPHAGDFRRHAATAQVSDGVILGIDNENISGESGGAVCVNHRLVGIVSTTRTATGLTSIEKFVGEHVKGLHVPADGRLKTLKSVEVYHFSAPWCGPCQLMEPVVRKLKNAGMPIRDINTDTDPQTARQMGVSSIPAFVVVKDGKPVDRIINMTTEGAIRRMYERWALVKADCAKPEDAPPPPDEPKPPLVPTPDPISTPGPAGPQGPPGPPGPPGKDGKDADVSFLTIEINRLRAKVAELEASRKPYVIQYLDQDGNVAREETFPYGAPIRLPAIQIEIGDDADRLLDKWGVPIGEPLRLSNVPGKVK